MAKNRKKVATSVTSLSGRHLSGNTTGNNVATDPQHIGRVVGFGWVARGLESCLTPSQRQRRAFIRGAQNPSSRTKNLNKNAKTLRVELTDFPPLCHNHCVMEALICFSRRPPALDASFWWTELRRDSVCPRSGHVAHGHASGTRTTSAAPPIFAKATMGRALRWASEWSQRNHFHQRLDGESCVVAWASPPVRFNFHSPPGTFPHVSGFHARASVLDCAGPPALWSRHPLVVRRSVVASARPRCSQNAPARSNRQLAAGKPLAHPGQQFFIPNHT
jgi:hypothetical protein